MIIRTATPDDAVAIAHVHVRSWQAAYRGLIPQDHLDALDPMLRAERWERAISRPQDRAATLVAENRGQVVGFANVGPSRDGGAPNDEGEVRSIYADPGHWGSGAGRKLMIAAVEHLRAAGYAHAILWVLVGNDRARGFYEAGGWASDGATQQVGDFSGVDEIRYRLLL